MYSLRNLALHCVVVPLWDLVFELLSKKDFFPIYQRSIYLPQGLRNPTDQILLGVEASVIREVRPPGDDRILEKYGMDG